MMNQNRLHEIESHCTQESPPRCRAACPFGLDVRAFMARMAEGRPGEARRLLELHLPLPGIMARICDHPCENVCLRRDLGGSVALHGLELACMLTAGPQGRTLPLPPKRLRMAVLGAGLAGLAAAWDLARKAYPVTVFHRGAPLDALLTRYPQLQSTEGIAKDFAAEDMAALTARNVVFAPSEAEAALLERAAEEYDAVLLDADAFPELAPETAAVEPDTLLWRGNICCAGRPGRTATGHAFIASSRQAGEGRQAAQTMERLAGKVSLTAARVRQQNPLHTDVTGIAPVPQVEPAVRAGDEGLFDAQEARAEAQRCLQCECLICVRQCAYLQKYKGYPRLYARQAYNNAAIVKGLHTANAMINGCALCGRCEELCPENFSMAELCLAAREDMVERGFMPPSAHEFALEDMENASGPDCALTLPDTGADGGAPAWLFFPGCQLAASRGEQVAALYERLRAVLAEGPTPGVALMLSCCGIPARWAGRTRLFREHAARLRAAWERLGRPRVMAACASCLTVLRETLPEAQALSVWEVLDGLDASGLRALRDGLSGSADGAQAALPELFSMHDPCAARHDAAWLAAVRSLARKCGARIEEPRFSGATTGCCGYGGLVWCAQPELAGVMGDRRAAELPHPGLASCIMCRDRLVAGGKECLHLLDVLLPGAFPASGATPGPGLSARRANRAALRARLLARGGAVPEPPKPSCRLRVAPDLLARLEERHILLTDVTEAVAGAEACGHWFENREDGCRLGSWRPRKVTFWVAYRKRGEEYELRDAWCHRMIVPGAGGQEAEDVVRACQSGTDGGKRERS
jgi:Fe-S oxidoreductase